MNYKKMLTIDALFEGGRMFVGATSVTYLMQRGLDISQISLLKSIQALTVLFGEYPTGIIADHFGRKKSLYVSLASAILGFLSYAFGHSLPAFIVAEVLTALSLCFWSGAYEAYAIEAAHLESEEGLMDKFFHSNQSLNSAAVLLFGVLGGIIAEKTFVLPYLSGAFVLTLCASILLNSPNEIVNSQIKNSSQKGILFHMRNSLSEGVLSPNLLPFVLASIAIQFAIQPLLHLWQPFFSELNGHVSTSFNSWVFSFYCAMNVGAGFLAAKYSKKEWFRSQSFLLATMTLFSVLYVVVGALQSPLWVLLFFGIAQGILSVGRTTLSVRMNQKIPQHSRASILSSVSLFSRFGMLAALQWMQLLSHDSSKSSMVYHKFASTSAVAMAAVIVGILCKNIFSKKEFANEN